MLRFSLSRVAAHTLKIADQWELLEEEIATTWRSYQSVECQLYSQLAKFPDPIQQLIVRQLKKAMKANDEGEIPQNLNDELSCTCVFSR